MGIGMLSFQPAMNFTSGVQQMGWLSASTQVASSSAPEAAPSEAFVSQDSICLLSGSESPQETPLLSPDIASGKFVSPQESVGGALQPQETGAGSEVKATELQELPEDATDAQTAAYCNGIALSDRPFEERAELITTALSKAVAKTTDTPNPEWVKASPQQLRLYVEETLDHTDGVRAIGQLRGEDFTTHDLEPKTGKFEPRIAQYLALPGREDSVKWAIKEHNASPHHDLWHNPSASKEELAESATDIVNAWRMERRVYQKPPWGWDRIASVINEQFQSNEISVAQRDALYEAIPYQQEYEAGKA